MIRNVLLFHIILTLIACSAGCKSVYIGKGQTTALSYHSNYDDTTVMTIAGPILLPYNRFIDPAGSVVHFGDPDRENHSLDCIILPDGKTLAVEDRYGITIISITTKQVLYEFQYKNDKSTKGLMSTYSGIKTLELNGKVHIFWSAANNNKATSVVLDGTWDGKTIKIEGTFDFAPIAPSPLALPNDIAINKEEGDYYMYVALNGNSTLDKIRLSDKKTIWSHTTGMAPFGIALSNNRAYVTNWAGPQTTDSSLETAGVPYGSVYINHRTGGTLRGTVSVFDLKTGNVTNEINVGLHPNAIITSPDQKFVYVSNGNSDNVYVINTITNLVTDSIPVRISLKDNPFIGSSPNALAINRTGTRLYVANGMDNALAVIELGSKSSINKGNDKLLGYIPTEAYPAGIALDDSSLYVCNLEGEGSRIPGPKGYTAHHEQATVSIIPIPGGKEFPALTQRVENANLLFRTKLSQLLPRKNVAAKPLPERIGEPSLIKHVVYIIKENRTYDQVLGDIKAGDGQSSLCIFGDSVTPNQHELANNFMLLDNYYASGKSSAEGHQWTDAAMTSDYVEKNVRAWFRSYPHVQNDALVYNKEGFIWNNALDHGKSVRIFGEACDPEWDRSLKWKDIYSLYKQGKHIDFKNNTTISRVRPILDTTCPCADTHDFMDVMRADAFIGYMKLAEQKDSDTWPQLMIVSLSDDHTAGTRPGIPTPRAMVADNDLAVGKIVDAISHSKYWQNTAIFITEDDSQDGWDHVSAYRTTGFVVSPYSGLRKTVHTNYNQTCMVRTIEQILGLPPMNVIDATALPMFDCFSAALDTTNTKYRLRNNIIPLDEMNKDESYLRGKELNYAILSSGHQYDKVDGGDDNLLNHILWFSAKGNKPYPSAKTLKKKDKDDDGD